MIEKNLDDLSDALDQGECTQASRELNDPGCKGLQVPNLKRANVPFRDAMETPEFKNSDARCRVTLGVDSNGKPVVGDLANMKHMLIAGGSGSGKSVALQSLIMSGMLANSPQELQYIMVDPKIAELTPYDGCAHMATPVITDKTKVAPMLRGLMKQHLARATLFSKYGVTSMDDYNDGIKDGTIVPDEKYLKDVRRNPDGTIPRLALVIDELGEMTLDKDVSKDCIELLTRLGNVARTSGISMVLATQKPDRSTLPSIIKSNLLTRIGLKTEDGATSTSVIDTVDAKRLAGNGDGLIRQPGQAGLKRILFPFLKVKGDVPKLLKELTDKFGSTKRRPEDGETAEDESDDEEEDDDENWER